MCATAQTVEAGGNVLGGSDGLYYYGARWYDSALGRFTSPDTIIPESSQGTQAWDRMAYVNNNPTKYTDPTGHSTSCTGSTDSKTCTINGPDFGKFVLLIDALIKHYSQVIDDAYAPADVIGMVPKIGGAASPVKKVLQAYYQNPEEDLQKLEDFRDIGLDTAFRSMRDDSSLVASYDNKSYTLTIGRYICNVTCVFEIYYSITIDGDKRLRGAIIGDLARYFTIYDSDASIDYNFNPNADTTSTTRSNDGGGGGGGSLEEQHRRNRPQQY